MDFVDYVAMANGWSVTEEHQVWNKCLELADGNEVIAGVYWGTQADQYMDWIKNGWQEV